jgi:2-deoxy-D-gluconate 3-dehydrogenase
LRRLLANRYSESVCAFGTIRRAFAVDGNSGTLPIPRRRPNRKGSTPLNLSAFSLEGKTALVTGSSRGLGAGIAVALATAGASVALHGSRSVPEEVQKDVAATGARSVALTGDVGDPAVCARLVEQTVAAFGSIDILVNNAGIIRRAPAAEYSAEDWDAVINVNLNSVFRLTQLAGRHMLAKGYGKIINIASLLSFQGGVTVPAYAAAKGGVAQLTKAFANEWAAKGVNVNAIAPGYMATDNTEALQNNPERARQILERIPAGRWGTPEDLGGTAVFLASSASDYISGHILVVDGGWLNR